MSIREWLQRSVTHKMYIEQAKKSRRLQKKDLTYGRLPTNRNFVHGGPTGRAAQVLFALRKREDTTMATPDKDQSKKHFFQVPDKFEMRSQAEKDAFYELVIDTLLGQERAERKAVEKSHEKIELERE